jgi:molecular chaperone DnaK
LTTEQRIVLKAERQANLEAEQNGGKPTKQGLETLYKAYEKVGNNFRAAETLELLKRIVSKFITTTKLEFYTTVQVMMIRHWNITELAYNNNKNATTAFNYAYKLKHKDKAKFKEILEESLRLDPNKPHSLFELGRLLKKEKDPKGKR